MRNTVDVTWRPELAYVLGLITSDGYLHSQTRRIGFVSKDRELVEIFKKTLDIKNPIYLQGRGGDATKRYSVVTFKSKQFHDFLQQLGITPAKSKIIRSVRVPDELFGDFLRGLYDGDGTFWTEWDTRWPKSFVYHLGFTSASRRFIDWLKERLTNLYGVKGYVAVGKGAYTIRYVKGDSRRLYEKMYGDKEVLRLQRKYQKITDALDFDRKLHENIHTPR